MIILVLIIFNIFYFNIANSSIPGYKYIKTNRIKSLLSND